MEWPIITKDTPIEEIHRIHKAIWQYVMDNGEKPETPYIANCVLCSYENMINPTCYCCKECPGIWSKEKCYYDYSEYNNWSRDAKDYEKQKELAQKIRDIPFKYEKEVKNNGRSKNE